MSEPILLRLQGLQAAEKLTAAPAPLLRLQIGAPRDWTAVPEPSGWIRANAVGGGLNPRINGDQQNLGTVFAVKPW